MAVVRAMLASASFVVVVGRSPTVADNIRAVLCSGPVRPPDRGAGWCHGRSKSASTFLDANPPAPPGCEPPSAVGARRGGVTYITLTSSAARGIRMRPSPGGACVQHVADPADPPELEDDARPAHRCHPESRAALGGFDWRTYANVSYGCVAKPRRRRWCHERPGRAPDHHPGWDGGGRLRMGAGPRRLPDRRAGRRLRHRPRRGVRPAPADRRPRWPHAPGAGRLPDPGDGAAGHEAVLHPRRQGRR